MYRSTCESGPTRKAHHLDAQGGDEEDEVDFGGGGEEGDSSKENSVVDGNHPRTPLPTASKTLGGSPGAGGGRSPWGHTLTPKGGSAGHNRVMSGVSLDLTNRPVMASSPSMSVSPGKQSVPWNDLSFAAEVLSPGFTGRVVRAAHVTSPRIVREGRRQYPTAQERYVRAGVIPNVRLSGRTKAVLTPKRTPTSPLIPLSRSPSAFSSSLSSDFLSSATPRMPDIRSVASVLEPVNTSSECVRDPTSVQAVVAALQQAQAGKGVKRGSCYMEAEDLSKRQRCSTPGASSGSAGTTAMPVNYSRDYLEDSQNQAGNGHASVGNGGEKRALDLSPSQGSSQQISPENKRRCVLDPMHASLSSSKYLDFSRLQGSGRDTPYSMYESRHDTDSESNRSVDSGQSKASEQSLHQQTSEATGGDSCVVSPGPSERDLSDRSGSHTPQSTRGESWNSVVGGNGGTANTSRTSTPRNPTPPHHNHVITLEAYKAEKTKSQQRLKKMLGMLFHVNEIEETASSKSGSSTPVTSVSSTKVTAAEVITTSAPSTMTSLVSILDDKVSSKTSVENSTSSSSNTTVIPAETSKNEVTTTFTFSLKPASSVSAPSAEKPPSVEKPTGESEEKEKESGSVEPVESNEVSVNAVIKLPSAVISEAKQPSTDDSPNISPPNISPPTEPSVSLAETIKKPSTLVDFLKSTAPPKTSSGVSDTVAANPLLQSQLSMPSQLSVTPATPVSETSPLFNIPALPATTTTSSGQVSLGAFAPAKTPDTSSSPTSAGFTFSASPNTKVPSLFSFGVSSSGTPQSDSMSVIAVSKSSVSPFVFGPGSTEKLPSTSPAATSAPSATSSSINTSGGLASTFIFGSTPVASSEPSNPPALPSTAVPTVPSFSIPSATTSSQGGIFTFGSVKTTAAAPESTPSISTVGNSGHPTSTPGMMFTFGASTQGPTKTSAPAISTQHGSNPQVLPFKDTTLVTSSATAGFSFGPSSGGTSTSTGALTQNVVSPSSIASTLHPSTFTFGQPATSQAVPSTTSSSGFNFSSTLQTTGAPSVFQFGTTTASQDSKAPAPSNQLFPPAIGSSQGSVTSSSSPFTFGSSGTATSPASPFSFGAPKTDNPAPPTFGNSADSSLKPATQSGFTFSTTPAATTNTFSAVTPSSTSNAFSSTTNTSTASSTGFNFGATAAAPGFSFGSSTKAPTTTTATSVSPFSFGSTAANKTSFGAPTTTTTSPFSFASNTGATPTFGSNPQGFGGPTTSTTTFGTATPSFGSSTSSGTAPFPTNNAFGSTSTTPSFGSSFATGGSTTQPGTTTSPFGTQGGSLTFGTPSSAPSFGAASGTAAPATPAFGGPSATPAAPTFGAPTNATPTFGNNSTTPASGTFGATQTPSFGSSFGAASTSTGNNNATSPFQFGQSTANPAPTFGLGGGSAAGSGVFQFGTGNAPASPFNAGNPGAGSRRPRNRPSRRHR
ncbi:uncharacterized protein [Macrobrachium rosenbergii]|uniref:uncharacterized protein isoform X2 n=1 Tax=Macrobrachium rosenbergii TaxID=79674 RepID=UPI0034D5CD4A